MWDELQEDIDIQLGMLRNTLDTLDAALAACEGGPPDDILIIAIGAMLHGFYNGIENIFKRIALAVDGEVPKDPAWHGALLRAMSTAKSKRPCVLSPELYESLLFYMNFRHVFRRAYPEELRWSRMERLAKECRATFASLEGEISKFMSSLGRAES